VAYRHQIETTSRSCDRGDASTYYGCETSLPTIRDKEDITESGEQADREEEKTRVRSGQRHDKNNVQEKRSSFTGDDQGQP